MANGIVTRPSAEHADVPALQDAYEKMQAISESDNRSWIYWAEFHGFNRYECWHHARVDQTQFDYDLFLPWHRAYLSFFENAARDQNLDAVLPWWDWTSDLSHQIGLPAAYTAGGPALQSGPVPAIDGAAGEANHSQPERSACASDSRPDRQTRTASTESSILPSSPTSPISSRTSTTRFTGGSAGTWARSRRRRSIRSSGPTTP